MSMNLVAFGRWAGGIAALLALVSANAATLASATISDLRFELVDLAPGTGNVLALGWSVPFGTVEATLQTGQAVVLFPQADHSVLWGVSFASQVTDTTNTALTLLESVNANKPGVSAAIAATQVSSQAQANSGGQLLTGSAYASATFTLSPHTELRALGMLSTSTKGPGSAGFIGPAGVSLDVGVPFSQAYAYAEVFVETGSALQTSSGLSNTPNTQTGVYGVDDFIDTASTPFLLSFRNDSNSDLTGSFYAQTQVSALELAALVPEPATGALCAMGLLVVGARGRSRMARAGT